MILKTKFSPFSQFQRGKCQKCIWLFMTVSIACLEKDISAHVSCVEKKVWVDVIICEPNTTLLFYQLQNHGSTLSIIDHAHEECNTYVSYQLEGWSPCEPNPYSRTHYYGTTAAVIQNIEGSTMVEALLSPFLCSFKIRCQIHHGGRCPILFRSR